MTSRRISAIVLTLLVAIGVAAPAFADEATGPRVDEINTVDANRSFVVFRADEKPDKVDVVVNGTPADISSTESIVDSDLEVYTVYVLDNSDTGRTDTVDELATRKAAIAKLLANTSVNERVSIITTGGAANLRIGFTRDVARASGVLDRLVPNGPSALWDATRAAGLELAEVDGDVERVVIVADQTDYRTDPNVGAARGEILGQDAYVYVLSAQGSGFPATSMKNLVSSAGGKYVAADSFADLDAKADVLGSVMASTYMTTFASATVDGGNDLAFTVDGVQRSLNMVPGSSTTGSSLTPDPPIGGTDSFFASRRTLTGAILLGGLAAGLAAYAFVLLVQKPESQLTSVLRMYGGEEAVEHANSARDLFERAVEKTENFAERQGVLEKVEKALEQADLALRPAEALVFQMGIVLATGATFFVLTQNLIFALVGLALGIVVPPQVVKFKAARRRKKFVAQLPEMLQLLASTLKAGYSFLQGVEAVSHEVDGAMGQELRRVITEAQLGRPIEEALEASAKRMDSEDFGWAVLAVRIQREVGGNLSELLMTVSDTMVARTRLAGEVAALTAEGKISAIVLGIMPPGLGVVMYGVNPDYIALLWQRTIGMVMLGAGVVSALIGFAWMKKIITIEI